jgi:hypothetical protein
MLVLVVAKKVREELSVFSGIELREGIAIAHPFAGSYQKMVMVRMMNRFCIRT